MGRASFDFAQGRLCPLLILVLVLLWFSATLRPDTKATSIANVARVGCH
jgi:hypothetical protein